MGLCSRSPARVHPTRQADAERIHRELQRHLPRRLLEPALVPLAGGRAANHRSLAERLQRGTTPQLARTSHSLRIQKELVNERRTARSYIHCPIIHAPNSGVSSPVSELYDIVPEFRFNPICLTSRRSAVRIRQRPFLYSSDGTPPLLGRRTGVPPPVGTETSRGAATVVPAPQRMATQRIPAEPPATPRRQPSPLSEC